MRKKKRKCLFENNLILLALKVLTSSMSVATSPSTSIGALDIECLFSPVRTSGRSVIFSVFKTLTRPFPNDCSETRINSVSNFYSRKPI